MRCETNLHVTGIKHHKLGGEKDVTKDVDTLAHVRLDASKTICSIDYLSVFFDSAEIRERIIH